MVKMLSQSDSIRAGVTVGAQGPLVVTIRELLAKKGFPSRYDGLKPDVFDKQLASLVMGFQQVAGLKVDGIVGPKTWLELGGTPLQPAMPPVEIVPSTPPPPESEAGSGMGMVAAAGVLVAGLFYFLNKKQREAEVERAALSAYGADEDAPEARGPRRIDMSARIRERVEAERAEQAAAEKARKKAEAKAKKAAEREDGEGEEEGEELSSEEKAQRRAEAKARRRAKLLAKQDELLDRRTLDLIRGAIKAERMGENDLVDLLSAVDKVFRRREANLTTREASLYDRFVTAAEAPVAPGLAPDPRWDPVQALRERGMMTAAEREAKRAAEAREAAAAEMAPSSEVLEMLKAAEDAELSAQTPEERAAATRMKVLARQAQADERRRRVEVMQRMGHGAPGTPQIPGTRFMYRHGVTQAALEARGGPTRAEQGGIEAKKAKPATDIFERGVARVRPSREELAKAELARRVAQVRGSSPIDVMTSDYRARVRAGEFPGVSAVTPEITAIEIDPELYATNTAYQRSIQNYAALVGQRTGTIVQLRSTPAFQTTLPTSITEERQPERPFTFTPVMRPRAEGSRVIYDPTTGEASAAILTGGGRVRAEPRVRASSVVDVLRTPSAAGVQVWRSWSGPEWRAKATREQIERALERPLRPFVWPPPPKEAVVEGEIVSEEGGPDVGTKPMSGFRGGKRKGKKARRGSSRKSSLGDAVTDALLDRPAALVGRLASGVDTNPRATEAQKLCGEAVSALLTNRSLPRTPRERGIMARAVDVVADRCPKTIKAAVAEERAEREEILRMVGGRLATAEAREAAIRAQLLPGGELSLRKSEAQKLVPGGSKAGGLLAARPSRRELVPMDLQPGVTLYDVAAQAAEAPYPEAELAVQQLLEEAYREQGRFIAQREAEYQARLAEERKAERAESAKLKGKRGPSRAVPKIIEQLPGDPVLYAVKFVSKGKGKTPKRITDPVGPEVLTQYQYTMNVRPDGVIEYVLAEEGLESAQIRAAEAKAEFQRRIAPRRRVRESELTGAAALIAEAEAMSRGEVAPQATARSLFMPQYVVSPTGGLMSRRAAELAQRRGKGIRAVKLNGLFSDLIPGGRGDDLPDYFFDPEQLRMGLEVEREHTTDPRLAREIAKDHLTEAKDYYTRLLAAGL